MPGTILITGCNRGIGLELTRQFSADDWQVIATCRNPAAAWELSDLAAERGNIEIHALDVTDYAQMTALAKELHDKPLDILLSNAGYYGPKGVAFGNVDVEEWRKVLETNTIAPYKLVETFHDNLQAGARKVVGVISSKVGSIADNSSGGGYLYRSSKTAVNQVVKSLSVDLADNGITVLAFHPGWVQTDMGGPNALISTTESVSGLKQQLTSAGLGNSGHFYNYDGSEIPW